MKQSETEAEELTWKCSNLILDNPRFDKKFLDQGQWVCHLMYGSNWMESPDFKAADRLYPNLTKKDTAKLKKLHEWLLAEKYIAECVCTFKVEM